MSDYDAVPMFFAPSASALPNSGKFTSFGRHVPALVVGSASQWDFVLSAMLDAGHEPGAIEAVGAPAGLFSDMYALLRLQQLQLRMPDQTHFYVQAPLAVAANAFPTGKDINCAALEKYKVRTSLTKFSSFRSWSPSFSTPAL